MRCIGNFPDAFGKLATRDVHLGRRASGSSRVVVPIIAREHQDHPTWACRSSRVNIEIIPRGHADHLACPSDHPAWSMPIVTREHRDHLTWACRSSRVNIEIIPHGRAGHHAGASGSSHVGVPIISREHRERADDAPLRQRLRSASAPRHAHPDQRRLDRSRGSPARSRPLHAGRSLLSPTADRSSVRPSGSLKAACAPHLYAVARRPRLA